MSVYAGSHLAQWRSMLAGSASGAGGVVVSLGPPADLSVTNVKSFPFLATGDGVTDDAAAIEAAVAFVRTLPSGGTVLFPFGVYAHATTLNFVGTNLRVVGQGAVLYFTGTGVAVALDGGATAYYGGGMDGITIRGQANCTKGLVLDNTHHGQFVNITVQDVASIAFEFQNSVCNYFSSLRCSGNEQGTWGTRPVTGLKLIGWNCTANTFVSTIMEGVSGDGILFDGATRNLFLGGTSEGCARGITLPADSDYNYFENIDCEANAISDFDVASSYNTFFNCLGASKVALGGIRITAGVSTAVMNGMYHHIIVGASALNATLIGAAYSLYGAPDLGTYTNAGEHTTVVGMVDNQTAAVTDRLQVNGAAWIVNELTVNGSSSLARPDATDIALYTSKTNATADTNSRFNLLANGGMSWGPGNAAVDTNLYRSSAGFLATDFRFGVGQTLELYASGIDGTEAPVAYIANSGYPATWRHRISASQSATAANSWLTIALTNGASTFLDVIRFFATGKVLIPGPLATTVDGAEVTTHKVGVTTLTDATATAIVTITMADGARTGGELAYTVEVTNAGGDNDVCVGSVRFAAQRKSSTVTCTIGAIGTGVVTKSHGGADLTVVATADVSSGTSIVLKLNADTALTPTTCKAHWHLTMLKGHGAITG